MIKMLKVMLSPTIMVNALSISVVVGVVLNLINQGDKLLGGSDIQWGHVVMNFVVPFCVASFSAAKNELERVSFNCTSTRLVMQAKN